MSGPTRSRAQVGEVLAGRYRIDGLLGEGGMGTVFRATELAVDRAVAIKLLALALADEPEIVARFQREAKLLAKFDHPALAQLLSVDTHEGVPMLVMKLVPGKTLGALLHERGRLARGQALPLLDQLCAALDYLHARGVVHRDLKPGNLMVDEDGRLTVLDFGISHYQGAVRLTSPGAFVGTPNYMAPEQIVSDECGPAADIYGLALITWQMLVGEHPFGAKTPGVSEMLTLQVNAMPALASRANPAVPAPVARVIDRSLEKDPPARHPTARAFYEDVVKAFSQDSTEGARDEPRSAATAGPVPRLPSDDAKTSEASEEGPRASGRETTVDRQRGHLRSRPEGWPKQEAAPNTGLPEPSRGGTSERGRGHPSTALGMNGVRSLTGRLAWFWLAVAALAGLALWSALR